MLALDLVAAFPLVGFVVLLFGGRRLGDPRAGVVATAAVLASFVAAIVAWVGLLGRTANQRVELSHLYTWFQAGHLTLSVTLRLDPLSVVMILFVTGVASLIHIYSIGYMKNDPRYHVFFVYLNLFVFSMIVLVTANNFALTFLGWEGVGACSYWLISFWFERPSAASAGKKAFIVNRMGDVGFLIGSFLVFTNLHSLSFSQVLPAAHQLSSGTAEAIALCFFLAAAGKSAQLPLFVWLLDAMEGPTPVSALIHAATMVTAGVYLMARLSPILALAPVAQTTIAVIGVATAFVAAMAATSQHDIKKIVAYSTVSQLGYMMLGIGTGAYVAAIFLMVTHAFYKALIFLSSGSVIHSLDSEQDIRKMGGLRKLLPITSITMILAWLSIAGVPPFSGFFSKGSVLEGAFAKSPFLWAAGVVTAILTAYYMGRLVYVVFYEEPRWQETAQGHTPHESPRVMTIPLIVLAAASVVGGVIDLPFGKSTEFLTSWLGTVVGPSLSHYALSGTAKDLLLATDAVAALIGVFLAWRAWGKSPDHPALEPKLLANGWYIDRTFDRLIAQPGTAAANLADQIVDPLVIDGAVSGVVRLARFSGGLGRQLQSGLVRSYLLVMVGGIVVMLGYVLVSATR
ncbi:MAG: NADH-quinone oxidoreductase subunit L [Ferrimicrobium sp.]